MLLRAPRPEPESPACAGPSAADRFVLDAGHAILASLPSLATAIDETQKAMRAVLDTTTTLLTALSPDPATPTGAGILAARDMITAPVRAAFGSIRAAIADRESPVPVATRASFIRKRMLAVITTLGIGGAWVLDTIGAPQLPDASAAASAGFRSPGGDLPSPDLPEAEIFDALEHPDDVKAFLGKHTGHKFPADLLELLATYRASPEELLRVKNLPCNAPSEFWARWLAHRGARPVVARLVPSLEKWEWKQCHEVTILRTSPGQYIIFSNDTYTVIDDCDSAQAALKKEYPTLHLLPVCGLVPWVRTNDNWLARGAHLSGWNMEQLPEHPLHAIASEPADPVSGNWLQRILASVERKTPDIQPTLLHDDDDGAYSSGTDVFPSAPPRRASPQP